METKPAKNAKLITPVFRVSFPSMFEAKAAPGSDKAKYSVVMLFNIDPKKGPVADLKAMKDAVRAAVIGRWGPDQLKWPKGLVLPFRKGEEKDYDGYGAGTVFVVASASADRKPYLVDQTVKPIVERSEFYGGCYAQAAVNAFAWPGHGKPGYGKFGVSFGLLGVQKVKDGPAFGNTSRAEDDFDTIAVPGDAASKAEDTTGVDDGLGL